MKSLLARLLLVVTIALAPTLAFQIYNENQAHRAREKLMEGDALRLLRLVIAEQQRIAEGAEQALDALGGAPAVLDRQPDLCPHLLGNMLAQEPRYVFASVIGLDGHLICASSPFERGTNASDRAYFIDALRTGGFVIGEYAVGRVTGQKSVHLAKPFKDRNGVVAGVIELALSLDWLSQQLDRLGLPPEVAVSIMDRNGTLLARSPNGNRFFGDPLSAENHIVLEGDKIGVAAMRARDGRPRLVAYAPPDVEQRKLAIAVGLDREVSYAAVTEANRIGLLLIVTGTGWALGTTALLGTFLIRRPFRRLLAVADHWRCGDLAARTGLGTGGSEFNHLGVAFDRMADALEARETALRKAANLEQRVCEEAAARERQNLLMAELDHRVKNMLATIQALAVQSGNDAGTLENFLETFEGRLRAMSQAHGLLTKSRWEGISLHELIAEEIAPFVGKVALPVEIKSDLPVLLKPKAALAFSLAVHELATNAAKYGALSVPGGRVHVDWHAEQRNGDVLLVLRWRETGGPAVSEPTHRGFGLTLIEKCLNYELGGTVQLGFPAEGVTCTIVVPRDQLAEVAACPTLPALPAQVGRDDLPATVKGKRVLVVEDNALLATLVVRQLKMMGASAVGPVARLDVATELAETAEIDIALLDVDLDGTMIWPAADCLLRRGIPFLFATGYQASLVVPERFRDCPVMAKPFKSGELQEALARLL